MLTAAESKGSWICKNSEDFLLPSVQPELHAEDRLKGRNRLRVRTTNPNSFFRAEKTRMKGSVGRRCLESSLAVSMAV